MEMPGCSLCMGTRPGWTTLLTRGASVFSTSTRNLNNRLANGAQVYLGSAEQGQVLAGV